VDPVPDPLLLRKSASAGNRTWTSGSVARTQTTRPQKRWFCREEIVLKTNWIGDWFGCLVRRVVLDGAGTQTPSPPVLQPGANRGTDRDIPLVMVVPIIL
jgi:hypothetical protein